jgi:hypothetical protein
MAGVITTGFTASFFLSKSSVQQKASVGAFASMLSIICLFRLVVIHYSQLWATFPFAIACIAIPPILFVAIYSSDASKSKIVAAQITAKRPTFSETLDRELRETMPKVLSIEAENEPDSSEIDRTDLVAESRVSSETCYAKAKTFRERGMHDLAARLFAESARLSTTSLQARKASLDAIRSYVEVGRFEDAKEIAVDLLGYFDELTSSESAKLDEALRLACV